MRAVITLGTCTERRHAPIAEHICDYKRWRHITNYDVRIGGRHREDVRSKKTYAVCFQHTAKTFAVRSIVLGKPANEARTMQLEIRSPTGGTSIHGIHGIHGSTGITPQLRSCAHKRIPCEEGIIYKAGIECGYRCSSSPSSKKPD